MVLLEEELDLYRAHATVSSTTAAMLYSRAALELEGEGGQRRDISPLSSRGGGQREVGGHTEAPRRALSEATLGGSPITLPSHGSHWLALHARALPGATHLPSSTRAHANSNPHSSSNISKSSISAVAEAGTQFTVTSTKVQILTQQLSLKLTAALTQQKQVPSLLALLVQKYKY